MKSEKFFKQNGFLKESNIDKALNYIHNSNLEYVSEGACRKIYQLNDKIVIKIPILPEDIWSNIGEFLFYRQNQHTNLLAPCTIRSLFKIPIILMQKVDSIPSNRKDLDELYPEESKIFHDNDALWQWGLINNSIKVYDYGAETYNYLTDEQELSIKTNMKINLKRYLAKKRTDFLEIY